MNLPADLQADLEAAERAIDEAQERMNAVQFRIAQWDCTQGRHIFGLYTKPPIGRACIYCRAPAPTEQNAVSSSTEGK